MARYVKDSKKKLSRKYGSVNGLPSASGKGGRIGMHSHKREGKPSEYKIGLSSKNQLRASYGILQGQFIRIFKAAMKSEDKAGHLLNALEFRLDNLVYRLGLAKSLPAARQMVVHGHIEVQAIANWRQYQENTDTEILFNKVDKPGYILQVGQRIRLKQKTQEKKNMTIEEAIANSEGTDYITLDKSSYTGYFTRRPEVDEIPINVEISKIIEFSSRSI